MTELKEITVEQPRYVSFINENRSLEKAVEIYEQRIIDALDVHNRYSESFQKRSCPVCSQSSKEEIEPFLNKYNIVKCKYCLTIFVDPCPSIEALQYYYNECKCNAMLGDLFRNRYQKGNIIISERLNFLANLIKNYLNAKKKIKILEIGCSSGVFLSELKTHLLQNDLLKFCELKGIDIDLHAVKKNIDNEILLEAISAEEYSLKSNEKFDIIIHFELIEHLHDPFSFMQSVRNLLVDGGLHHFHTPNGNGFDNKAMNYNNFRALAHSIFPPMHLQAFSLQNIVHFAIRSGFKIQQIDTPGNFDVDIVLNTLPKDSKSPFRFIHDIPKNYLAIFQYWLKELNASSHLRCTLEK